MIERAESATSALADTADERDQIEANAQEALLQADETATELALLRELCLGAKQFDG